MRDGIVSRFVGRVFGGEIERRVAESTRLAVRALDDVRDRLMSGRSLDTFPRDRHDYDREKVLADALDAWRTNPLARRIVALTSQYVVGGGLGIESQHEATHLFLQNWWTHRLNRMDSRAFEWCDELTRTGELFVVISTDAAGMSYLRAIPAADIQEIESAANDVEQEIAIYEKPDLSAPATGQESAMGANGLRGRRWDVYDQAADRPAEDGTFHPVMLHYAVNKPVGAKHGESDLAPLLRWLARYAAWLEDRARLNRYRNTFVFWVKAKFANQAEKLARQAELNANPPNPGSILVTDESETWSVLSPNLASFEAAEDGLALKKMISAGSGIPLHFIAEPESATRTTAESAGGPTFRHYEQRQLYFLWMIKDMAQIVLMRRAMVDHHVSVRAEIKVNGTDISARDNAALAVAASTVVGAFAGLRDRGLIDDAELLRVAYRFAGEIVDIEGMLIRGKNAPAPKMLQPTNPGGRPTNSGGRHTNPGGRPAGV
ncbi:MAG: hypothetical protein EHM70_23060, partial [Chloroflexota bacterium]